MINWIRWILAHVMSWLVSLRRPGLWTRYSAWNPTWCNECNWRGPLRWAAHGYQDDGSGEDVEAVDECPKCGSDHLEYKF